MEKFELKGIIKVGSILSRIFTDNPRGRLIVDKNKLELRGLVNPMELVFSPKDIISIEPYKKVSILEQGIKINHKVSTYDERVFFLTTKNPESVIKSIEETGFLNNTDAQVDDIVREKQEADILPIKNGVLALYTILGFIALAHHMLIFNPSVEINRPIDLLKSGFIIFFLLSFVSSILLLVSEPFRKLILKEGQALEDIKRTVIYQIIVSIVLVLLTFLLFYFL